MKAGFVFWLGLTVTAGTALCPSAFGQVINSVTDTAGVSISSAPGNALVYILGSGFGPSQGPSYVSLSRYRMGIISWSSAVIEFSVPPTIPIGNYQLEVDLWDGNVNHTPNASNKVPFSITPIPPSISYLSAGATQTTPNNYTTAAGEVIMIYGAGLSSFQQSACNPPAGSVVLAQSGKVILSSNNYRYVYLAGSDQIAFGLP